MIVPFFSLTAKVEHFPETTKKKATNLHFRGFFHDFSFIRSAKAQRNSLSCQ